VATGGQSRLPKSHRVLEGDARWSWRTNMSVARSGYRAPVYQLGGQGRSHGEPERCGGLRLCTSSTHTTLVIV
jgi:hypothetical protein